MSRQSRLARAGVVALLAAAFAAPASADTPIDATTRPSYVSTYGGVTAWSTNDERGRRLVLRINGKNTIPKINPRRTQFDVTLGPDEKNRTVALYTRCNSDDQTTGCDVYKYDLRTKKERLLTSVSLQNADELWPAQWKGNYVFARRRYNNRSNSEQDRCDAPFARPVKQKITIKSFELARGTCGAITGMALRKTTAAISMIVPTEGSLGTQIRTTSVNGGNSRLLFRSTFTGPRDTYSSPALDDTYVYATRAGVGPPPRFARVKRDGTGYREVEAQTILTGPVAWDKGKPTYVEAQAAPRGADCAPITPCRIMVADSSPFGSASRTLAPRLTLTPPPASGLLGNQPFTATGTLTEPTVRSGRIISTKAIAGMPIDILRADYAPNPTGQTLVPTLAPRSTTGPDGGWGLTVQPPVPVFGYYAAITRGAGFASQSAVVVFKTGAAITLDASPRAIAGNGSLVTFSGTVAPFQAGRSVNILRPLAETITQNIGQAPVQPDGSFSVALTVSAAGGYTAELPANPFDGSDGNATYQGTSAPVQITLTP